MNGMQLTLARHVFLCLLVPVVAADGGIGRGLFSSLSSRIWSATIGSASSSCLGCVCACGV